MIYCSQPRAHTACMSLTESAPGSQQSTCIHVSVVGWGVGGSWSSSRSFSNLRAPDDRGVLGGSGWMSLGTITRSRPSTRMAPAQATLKPEAGALQRARLRLLCAGDSYLRKLLLCSQRFARRQRGTSAGSAAALQASRGHRAHGRQGADRRTRIASCPAVVGGGEEGDQVPLREALEAVHDALMGTHDHLHTAG